VEGTQGADVVFFLMKVFKNCFEVIFQFIHGVKDVIIEAFLFPDIMPEVFRGTQSSGL
jgi:hypothetical protein